MLRPVALAVLFAVPALAAEPGWKQIDGDAFTVSFPGDATRSESVEPTDAGEVPTVSYDLAQADGAVYLVVVASDFSPEVMRHADPKVVLEGARDGAVGNTQGELKAERALTLEGKLGAKRKTYPGREFEAALPQHLTMLARVYLVESRLYQLMVVFDAAYDRRADFARLVASFQLKPRPAPTPALVPAKGRAKAKAGARLCEVAAITASVAGRRSSRASSGPR